MGLVPRSPVIVTSSVTHFRRPCAWRVLMVRASAAVARLPSMTQYSRVRFSRTVLVVIRASIAVCALVTWLVLMCLVYRTLYTSQYVQRMILKRGRGCFSDRGGGTCSGVAWS